MHEPDFELLAGVAPDSRPPLSERTTLGRARGAVLTYSVVSSEIQGQAKAYIFSAASWRWIKMTFTYPRRGNRCSPAQRFPTMQSCDCVHFGITTFKASLNRN